MCGECININNCGLVYCTSIPECAFNNQITVLAKLTGSTEYGWQITDKFNHKYIGTAERDDNGSLIINTATLPEQLLTRHSGSFSLKIFELVDAPCDPVQLNFCNLELGQVVREVRFTLFQSDVEEHAYIGCHCDDQGVNIES